MLIHFISNLVNMSIGSETINGRRGKYPTYAGTIYKEEKKTKETIFFGDDCSKCFSPPAHFTRIKTNLACSNIMLKTFLHISILPIMNNVYY
jgi:hypothetical protein